jgi:pimeloyl-ACP methyl ester carboxylesterase
MSGVEMTAEQCSKNGDSVWVEYAGKSECVRYYHSGLKGNSRAVVYLRGDRIFAEKPTGYTDNTAEQQTEFVARASQELGEPFIMIARPGTYGSSGYHAKRREMREGELVAAAIDAILTKHQLKDIALSGQSGGGSVAAHVATKLPKLNCLALSSASLSMKYIQRSIDEGKSLAQAMNPLFYDPASRVADLPENSNRRIFVIYDPEDKFVPMNNHLHYATEAKIRGHDVTLIQRQGAGPLRHTLDRSGYHAAAWCLQGRSSEEIVNQLDRAAIKG